MSAESGKTALVLAGGGIMGASYEIGCLSALDRLFSPGFSTTGFDIFIGVSAGSVIATLMANRIPPADLFHDIARDRRSVFNWRRRDIYRLDSAEILSDCWKMTFNLVKIFRIYRRNRWGMALPDLFHIIQEQFPSGIFSLKPMQRYLCQAFAKEGVLDDFHLLDSELYIPAYDLDNGQRVVFGSEGFREPHICQAITASCSIPYFFRPPRIGGRHYIDGSSGRVTHIDVAIERGARLILVINPRVPMINDLEHSCLPSLSFGKCSSIAELGITHAWEQAQRIEIKAQLDMALDSCRRDHPEVDIILIEPGGEESLLFFQSPMSNIARHHIMNYGYHLTLGQLKGRFEELRPIFARHNIRISDEKLTSSPPPDVVP